MTVGAGEAHPVASNDSETGRAQNRRVEMTIVPITKG
jgi:outer membrane protein OmpA-like peptidoglycan-associated protein